MSHVLDVQECANCSAPLHGAYCAHCGQKVAAIDPTVRRVVGELWDEVRRGWSVNANGPNFRLDGLSPEERRALGAEIMRLLPRAMFMMVPVFALMVGLMARQAGRNYPTHPYFALHVHMAYFALLALTTPLELLTRWAGVIGSLGRPLYALVYLAIAFRRVYAYGRISSAIRAAVISFTYVFMVVIAFLVTTVVAAYVSGAVRTGR